MSVVTWKDLFQPIADGFDNNPQKKWELFEFLRIIIRTRRNFDGNEVFSRFCSEAFNDPQFYDYIRKKVAGAPHAKIESWFEDLKMVAGIVIPKEEESVKNVKMNIMMEKFAELKFEYNGKNYSVAGHLVEMP